MSELNLHPMHLGVSIRNWLYDHEWLKSTKLKCRVISVGNITMGGTGKTPVVAEFLEICQKRNIKVGVVARGYKGKINTSSLVEFKSLGKAEAAVIYGDEPVLLKNNFPQVPIVVGPNKTANAIKCWQEFKPQIIFVDDGYQHRRLFRDVDIVLIDATTAQKFYQYPPLGRGRETWAALERASLVIVTKWNLASLEQQEWLKQKLKHCKWYQCEYETKIATQSNRVYLVSGIANPESFQKLVAQHKAEIEIVGFQHFSDHHYLSADEVLAISKQAQQLNAEVLLTEKDAIKLSTLPKDWNVATLKLKWNIGEQELNEILG